MSITTAFFGPAVESPAAEAAPRKSFLSRLMEARLVQSRSHVKSVFSRMSDEQMADIGFTPEQARQVRSTGIIPPGYWA